MRIDRPGMQPVYRFESRYPRVPISFRRPADVSGNGPVLAFEGWIDTGADSVVIPIHVARSLDLHRIDQRQIMAASGPATGIVYLARVCLPDLGFDDVIEAIALRGAPADLPVLIGLSLLSKFHLHYDGPAKLFTLTTP